jgi:dihydroflavonol-4-reductase
MAIAMTVLVTGASGFLGGHVARLLADRGDRVRVLLRPASVGRDFGGLHVDVVTGDLRDAPSLARAVENVHTVFHVAADYRLWARNPGEIYESNVTGTRNLLEAARAAGVTRFVYTSTVATVAVPHGDALPSEATVATLDQMIGHYKRSKWLAEQEALKAAKSGMHVVIVNPTTPVGPGDSKPTPTGRTIVDFLNGRMPAYVETGLNWVPVEDAAAGHLLAAERGVVGERYILGSENLSLKQVLDLLAAVSDRPAPRVRLPHAFALAAGYTDAAISRLLRREPRIPLEGVRMARHSMFVDAGRARRELGFAPGPVSEALGRAVTWFRANGYVTDARLANAQQAHAA